MPHKSLSLPDSRALLLFQDQLTRGMWADRHLNALIENPATSNQLLGVLRCTVDLMEGEANKQRASRNLLCLCHALCEEETVAWARCARKAAKAVKAGHEPEEDCTSYRVKLSRCTQRQVSYLLQAALVPCDKHDVSL
ncbi:hypothetical protein AB1Y20_011458 [Prymnesium parvum]|uniref:Uncharacterized protein n=1 Tax=Prymnesium parvum TaxID=97485 RepID=A0AB34IMY9_PRYPA